MRLLTNKNSGEIGDSFFERKENVALIDCKSFVPEYLPGIKKLPSKNQSK